MRRPEKYAHVHSGMSIVAWGPLFTLFMQKARVILLEQRIAHVLYAQAADWFCSLFLSCSVRDKPFPAGEGIVAVWPPLQPVVTAFWRQCNVTLRCGFFCALVLCIARFA